MNKAEKRVLVGMSGGIDSTATCLMLREQGYEIVGLTMWVWGDEPSEARQLAHPRSVKVLKMDGKPIEHDVVRVVNVYLCSFIMVFAASFIIVLLDNFDLTTSFTAVAATLNNIGPGLNMVGPTGNFADFSVLSKLVFIFDMLAGRLEIFPMLLLLAPNTWKKHG